ncbi:DUF6301 family protein [Nocardia pneumoniae]|uniref:DUF6301 family protein n=1 Tax=Nocardia pneumoniae TaxID=228601 RepID=UPI0002FFDE47|nr:DUF6301 family protein [Nocardia pneumoniae]
MTQWEQFADELAERLSTLSAGVIVKAIEPEAPGQFRLVQFAQDADSLVAELTGDAYLDPADRPTLEGRQRIIDAGWQLPDSDHGDNWWIELPWPNPASINHQLAAMVVAGLRDGFRIPSPNALSYDAWKAGYDNRSRELPSTWTPERRPETNLLKRQLTLVLHGPLDQIHLDRLRDILGLTSSGSATDAVGTQLGQRPQCHPKYRTITVMVLTLLRTDTHEWSITLDAIPGTQFSKWKCLAEISVRAAGLAIAERQRPSSTPTSAIGAPEPMARIDQSTEKQSTAGAALSATALPMPTPQLDLSTISLTGTTSLGGNLPAYDADLMDRAIRQLEAVSPYTPTQPPIHQPAVEDTELVRLVTGLRDLVWSWQMDDLVTLSARAGLWTIERHETDRVVLTSRYVAGEGYVHGNARDVYSIDLPVATIAAESNESRTQSHDIFTRMTTVLIETYGEPTERYSGTNPQVEWAGTENSLILAYQPPSVRVIVRLNPGVTRIYGEAESTRRNRNGEQL